MRSLTLVQLTHREAAKFRAAQIPSSGSSSRWAKGPQAISTWDRYLLDACQALGWRQVRATVRGDEWIVRRRR